MELQALWANNQLRSKRSQAFHADLAERVGGLHAVEEWAHVLSLGEQQRVAFARLLLHRPQLAFLARTP